MNELLSYFLWQNGWHTSVNNNICVLAEATLFLLFFRNMGLFEKQPPVFWGLFGALLILWGWENIAEGKIASVSSWFRITYSFLIVILSIAMISLLLYRNIHSPWITGERNIFQHPVFLICGGAIIFFTFKLVIEIFWLYGIDHSSNFRKNLYHILIYINPAVNLVKNIGYGNGTHTHSADDAITNLPLNTMSFPLKHPEKMILDIDYLKQVYAHLNKKYKSSIISRALRLLKIK